MTTDYKSLLQKQLKDLQQATRWLERSYQLSQSIGQKTNYTPEEFDILETLTSRYARVTDFLINKVLRTLDYVELTPPGSVIDVINKAHKRGLIDSAQTLRELKEIRNEISHEYAQEELVEIYQNVWRHIPTLLALINNTYNYIRDKKLLD